MEDILDQVTEAAYSFSYLTDTGFESGSISAGNGVTLPFPSMFECPADGGGFSMPFFTTFGDGTINISDIKLDYCSF